MTSSLYWRTASSIGGLLATCGAALGQYSTDFEAPTYSGSPTGTIITGQQGWYLPGVAGSVDGRVFTYADNALGVAVNASGGLQFEGGLGPTVRAQRQMDFSVGGVWRASWDCLAKYNGVAPAADFIGSWSQQDSTTTRYFQQVMTWGSVPTFYSTPVTNHAPTPELFHIMWGYHTAAAPTTIVFAVPSAAWQDLPVNNWFRVSVKWDFDAAQILEVSIRNLTTGGNLVVDDVSSLGWYLRGGPNSTLPLPTDIRLFSGNTNNVAAWDNLVIEPIPSGPTCYANCDGSTQVPFLNVADFSCFLSKFAASDPYANCDGSTTPPVLNVADFSCFLGKFAAGCSAP